MKNDHNDGHNSGGGITKGELENFDNFLDTHPGIREQVANNPKLLNDDNFLNGHPGLREFLNGHPGVRQEANQNPKRFMAREQHYQGRENATANSGGGITKGELENFDNFLDTHPGIREQVARNPKLLNDDNFLNGHPGLREFLNGHPGVRQEANQNPQRFMVREQQYQNRENATANANAGNRGYNDGGGITKNELENFDSFLDTHPGIRSQVANNPKLLNDDNFVNSHPGLREYLNGHPGVRQEANQNPQRFMAREQQYQKREDAEGRAR